ncbi:MAG: gliding motility-associated C-terminal domain-containing protein [Bacteroidota bacterium]
MKKALLLLGSLYLSFTAMAHETEKGHTYKFIENKGQFPSTVQFKALINNGALFLENNRFVFHFMDNSVIEKLHRGEPVPAEEQFIKGHSYSMTFDGANTASLEKNSRTEEYYNYYIGNDRSKWASKAWGYGEITWKKLYTGIDLRLFTHEEHLEYEYKIAPGTDVSQIRQTYDGAEVQIENGNLLVTTTLLTVTETRPVAWQMVNGKKKNVACEFSLNGNTVSYVFPKGYDKTKELIIDPVLIFGSSSGSTADNFGMTATYSSQGHLFTGGTAFNIGYPTTAGAYQTSAFANGSTYGVTDVVITKYLPNGTNLVYSTYIGGGTGTGGTETVHSLIVNQYDELFIFGVTSSTNFPTTAGAYDQTYNGGSFIGFVYNGAYFDNGTDIYVSKFSFDGTQLLASTFVGGSSNDGVNYNYNFQSGGNWNSNYDSLQFNYGDQFRGEIMVDDLGNCYVASTTKSSDFPTVSAFQPGFNGQQDGVAFKLDSTLSTLIWSTYIGGSNKDAAYSIKVDDNYNAYVAGGTASSNFPTTAGVLNTAFQGGKTDGFICKISPAGNTLLNSTFIGTNSYDQVYFVELDRFGGVYLLGQTQGTGVYPVVNVGYSNANSGQFITKLNNGLSAMVYSTLFGNSNGGVNISPSAFLVDVCGNVYVSGWGANILQSTPLNGMPVTGNAFQSSNGDGFNFYLIVFSRDINSLLYATYFGGPVSREHVDGGTSRFDDDGIVYQSVCAGCGGNDDFPTTPGAWSQVNNSTNCNNGVFKFDFEIEPQADYTTDILSGCAPLTIQFNNTSPNYSSFLWDFGNGDTTSQILNPTYTFSTPGTYTVYLIVEDSICGLLDTAEKIINVFAPLQLVTSDTVICNPASLTLVASSLGTVNSYVFSSNGNFTDTLNSPLSDSTINVNVSSDTSFFVQVNNGFCNYIDTITVTIPNPQIDIGNIGGICTGDTATLSVTNLTPQYTLTYNWGPDSLIISGDGTNTVTVSPDYDNWIWVIGTTPEGCTTDDSTFITVSGAPTGLISATATPNPILVGNSTQLNVLPNGYTYTWYPPDYLSNPNIQNPVATPPNTMTYFVDIANGGCVMTAMVIVEVLFSVCEEPYIYVPNAFTPNGDLENDFLFVRGNNITELLFRVYDRWGEKVFETTDINIGWDGTFRGRDCDPAVFDYYLKATCLGGDEFFKKGNVTLIR